MNMLRYLKFCGDNRLHLFHSSTLFPVTRCEKILLTYTKKIGPLNVKWKHIESSRGNKHSSVVRNCYFEISMKFIMYEMVKNRINDWHMHLLLLPISAFSLSPCKFSMTLFFVKVIKEHRHYVNSFSGEMKWKNSFCHKKNKWYYLSFHGLKATEL